MTQVDDTNLEDVDLKLPNWAAVFGVGILLIFFGIAASSHSPSVGGGIVIFAIILIIASVLARPMESEDGVDWAQEVDSQYNELEAAQAWEYDNLARQETRQKEIDEIVKRVKATIKVRCRYCGTLNEESAIKCESCGASM